jgi:4-diphosphocytidyl-2-C-methyl-D-erythritol kinase
VTAAEADRRLAAWLEGAAPAEELLFNNLEPAAFEKYEALPLLLGRLRRDFGAAVAMSGSGSACFALLPEPAGDPAADAALAAMKQAIRDCWGEVTFVQDTRLA